LLFYNLGISKAHLKAVCRQIVISCCFMARSMIDNTLFSFKIYGFLFCFCLIPILILGCDLFERDKNDSVLIIGSRHITPDELKKDMAFITLGIGMPEGLLTPLRDQLIEQIIDHYLIMEYGRENTITLSENELQQAINAIKKGYTEDAFQEALLRGYVDFEEWKARLKEQLLKNKIIKNAITSISPPSYKEIQSYYEENLDKFRYPRMLEFRQIVTRTKEEGENLLKRLHNGELMSELARKHSIAPEAENGGKVGWVALGNLDESMEKVLFSMSPGKMSPVIKTPYGYHIFEVLSIRPEGIKKLPDVISEIESKFIDEKREAAFKKWLRELRTHFKVKVNKQLLNTLELS
jgi:parvulin-like peptidyl-prolyl isomerase